MVLEEQWLIFSFWRGEPLYLLSLPCFILNRNFQETHTMEADCLAAPGEGRALAEPGKEVRGRAELLHACPLCWCTRKKREPRRKLTFFFSCRLKRVENPLLEGKREAWGGWWPWRTWGTWDPSFSWKSSRSLRSQQSCTEAAEDVLVDLKTC